jgi:hypothetical protein
VDVRGSVRKNPAKKDAEKNEIAAKLDRLAKVIDDDIAK